MKTLFIILILIMILPTYVMALSLEKSLEIYKIYPYKLKIDESSKTIEIYMSLGKNEFEMTQKIVYLLNALIYINQYIDYKITIIEPAVATVQLPYNIIKILKNADTNEEKYNIIINNMRITYF